MIAVDTSTWIAFLQGDSDRDADLLDRALQGRQALMVPVVLTEILSDPKLSSEVSQTLSELPLIQIGPDYWQRASKLRAIGLANAERPASEMPSLPRAVSIAGFLSSHEIAISGRSRTLPASISSLPRPPPEPLIPSVLCSCNLCFVAPFCLP
jgi:hypothetical protein